MDTTPLWRKDELSEGVAISELEGSFFCHSPGVLQSEELRISPRGEGTAIREDWVECRGDEIAHLGDGVLMFGDMF